MAFVADDQTPGSVEPRERALHNPAVAAEALACFDAAPGDAGDDPASAQVAPAAGIVVALVGVQLVGPPARASAPLADGPHGIDEVVQRLAVVKVGRGQKDGEREAGAVDQKVALAARLAAVDRVRADLVAPLWRERRRSRRWPATSRCGRRG